MNDIIDQNVNLQNNNGKYGIVELSEKLLSDIRANTSLKNSISFPIAEISALGSGVSSLIPAFNSITQTTTIGSKGLYTLVNAAAGDVLKNTKDGNFWGALKTVDGKSKMAKLSEVGSLNVTTHTVGFFNPKTLMTAAALYSIEKSLDEIKATQKKILDFLQIEKESSVEADVEALTKIISNYKHTWDNKLQVSSNLNTVNDIQTRSRKNINSYKKLIENILSSKRFIVMQSMVDSTYTELEKLFRYYRLSLYSFSLSIVLEILLADNQKTEYILNAKDEIYNLDNSYRKIFGKCLEYITELSESGIESSFIKELGNASTTIGNTIGNIPFLKSGQVDEFFKNSGTGLFKNARALKNKAVEQFLTLKNSEIELFINKIEDMAIIYNKNKQIYFDKQNVYLIS